MADEVKQEEQGQAPSTEVLLSVFLLFDKKKLFEQRDDKERRKPFELRAMRMLEESQFTVTYLSNPGVSLSRYDMAHILSQGSHSQTNPGSDVFGMDWHDLFRDDNRLVKPMAWGVQVNWSNSQRRIYGPLKTFNEAAIAIDNAFEDMQRHAERTVSLASGLMLLNGIMQATLQASQKTKPTGRSTGTSKRRN